MNTTIKCIHCGKEIEITEALKHRIEEEALISEREKHKLELSVAIKKAQEESVKRSSQEFERQMIELKKEKEEEAERNKSLIKQIENLTDEIRLLRRKDEERELTMKKKLADEEDKIRNETRLKFIEEHELVDKQKDQKLTDALKQIEQLKFKIQQGSQQTQGEVMELALENLLKNEFPDDRIEEVKKGQRGADIVQIVIDKKGRECGKILWESKNARWTESWIGKLREDQRAAKAQLSVLVVENPPENVRDFVFMDGVWVTLRTLIVPLAMALRFDLIHIFNEKSLSIGKNEKMEILYDYLTGTEFRHRIEGIAEAFTTLQGDIEKEKRWFNLKWARQEKEIRKIIDNTHGMYGELQAVTGRSLQKIENLELEEG